MKNLIRQLALITTVIALILLVSVLSQVGRPRHCIDSLLVKKLDIITTTGLTSVEACHPIFNAEIEPVLWPLVEQSRATIQKIEAIGKVLGLAIPNDGITVRIYQSKPFYYHVSAGAVHLGRDLFEAKGYLERALLESLVVQTGNWSLYESTLGREVLTDLLTISMSGELNLHSPLSKYSTYRELQWIDNPLRAILSKEAACQSSWNFSSRLSTCEEFALNKTHQIDPVTLRGLISYAATKQINKMSLIEKRKFALHLIEYSQTYNWSALPNQSRDHLNDMVTDAQDWLNRLNIDLNLTAEIDKKLQDSDLLIVADDKNDEVQLLKNIEKQFIFSGLTVLFQAPQGIRLSLLGPKIKSDKINFKPKKIVVLNAHALKVKDILNYKLDEERVLHIISYDESLNLRSYADGGIKTWMAANLSAKFRVYHLPSLLLAQKWGLKGNQIFSGQKPGQNLPIKLRNLLGIQNSRYIAKANVNMIPGPLSVIEWYR